MYFRAGSRYSAVHRHTRSHREGWRERPFEAPATTEREGANSVGSAWSERCDRKRFGLRVTTTERRPIFLRGFAMPAEALQCKECRTEYPLEARYVCDVCFGPLEVAYDLSGLDAPETRRRIQAGPHDIWRYADFLPFEQPPRTALAAGGAPLVRADPRAYRARP